MRSKNAFINMGFGIVNQFVLLFTNVLIRKAMVNSLGIDYLGVNGLFSNILALLNLTESGFGVAISYRLYKPIADNDLERIKGLLRFYSTIYRWVAFIVLGVGVGLIPLLPTFINNTTIPQSEIILYYFLYLTNSFVSYFVSYKISFLTAMQKGYYVSIINSVMSIVFSVLKIYCLNGFDSYTIFLLLTIINTIFANGFVSIVSNNRYPYVKKMEDCKLSKGEKNEIFEDCKAVILHKVGAYVLTGTDNLVISKFINLATVGLYSNYLMILNVINSTLSKVVDSMIPAFGDIMATEGKDSLYEKYNFVEFITFILTMFCSAMLVNLVQPCISVLFGKEYLLDFDTILILILNFYLGGMRRPISAIKSACGIYQQDKYAAILEAAINLIISIILVKEIGLKGVFIGTIVSGVLMPNLVSPYYIYRDVFNRKFVGYIVKNIEYFAIYIFVTILTYNVTSLINNVSSIRFFILKTMFSMVVCGCTCAIVAFLLPERKYCFMMMKRIIRK